MSKPKQPDSPYSKTGSFKNELQNFSAFQLLHVLKENLSDCYCVTDEEGYIVDVNEAYCHTLGYQKDELLEKNFTELLPQDMRPYALMLHHEYIWEHSNENAAEWNYQTKAGNIKLLRSTTTRLLTSENRRYKLEILFNSVIAEPKTVQSDELIRNAQHQFKNTLHEISGLLHLQATQLQEDAREAILLSQMRVTAIALAFELLYRSTQPDDINLAEYLSKLVGKYQQSFEIQIEQDVLYWQVNKAYALGLILIEFLHHAKADTTYRQKLKIKGRHSNSYYHISIVTDDHFKLNFSSFSKQLIHALGKQLQAKVDIQNHEEILRVECKL